MILLRDFLADQQVVRPARAPAAPRVSVVLPTYRRCASGRLQRAILSVLDQSLGDLELLVVDDGSTDGTRELVRGLQAGDPRLVYVRHERNCGLPALRVDEGIELARGRFLAFQFDDDSWRPDALAALVGAAEACPGPAMVCGLAVLTCPTAGTGCCPISSRSTRRPSAGTTGSPTTASCSPGSWSTAAACTTPTSPCGACATGTSGCAAPARSRSWSSTRWSPTSRWQATTRRWGSRCPWTCRSSTTSMPSPATTC